MRSLKITALGLMLTSEDRMSRPCQFAGGACRIAIAIALLLAVPTFVWSAETTKARLVVLSDINTANIDDRQTCVRLLMHANEVDIEGLIANSSKYYNADRQGFLNQINAYEQVLSNLQVHASGWPAPAYLRSITKGEGQEARDLIIAAVDKPDPRPVWFSQWGGARSLEVALDYIATTRSASQRDAFISKIRIFGIAGAQDGALDRAYSKYPSIYWINCARMYGNFLQYETWPITSLSWFNENVTNSHGPLGAYWVESHNPNDREGDSAALVALFGFSGVFNPNNPTPTYGSFGGRYLKKGSPNYYEEQADYSSEDYLLQESNGQTTNDVGNSIRRWRRAYQMEMAARADWCVKSSYAQANHPPVAGWNGSGGTDIIQLGVSAGQTVSLSAGGSSDPDGNELSYNWFVYIEADRDGAGYGKNVSISNATSQQASIAVPSDANGKMIHVLLEVKDNGTPSLYRHRRIVLNVGGSGGNQLPSVSITSPANGATLNAPASINIIASASDPDGSVSKVEFYQGSTKLGEDTSSPYDFTWSNVAAGSYSLTARATDNAGAVTTSAARTVTVQAPGGGTGTGLTAVYFDNMDFTGASISRTDATVDFNWGDGSPAAAIGADSFSARWTGQVEAPATGTWSFTTTSDDGIRLWVNGVQLINAWVNQSPTSYSGSIALTAGQRYDLKLEYFENGGGAMARLAWSGPGQASQVIPSQYLTPTSGTPTNAAPTVALTAPANGATATAPGSFAINATAADSDGTIAKVEFFAARQSWARTPRAPTTSPGRTWPQAAIA